MSSNELENLQKMLSKKLVEEYLQLLNRGEFDKIQLAEMFYDTLSIVQKKIFERVGRKEGTTPPKLKYKWQENFLEKMQLKYGSLLDHIRSQGGILVSHPYSLELDRLKHLIELCNSLELKFTITGQSEYRPGYSFKIILSKNR